MKNVKLIALLGAALLLVPAGTATGQQDQPDGQRGGRPDPGRFRGMGGPGGAGWEFWMAPRSAEELVGYFQERYNLTEEQITSLTPTLAEMAVKRNAYLEQIADKMAEMRQKGEQLREGFRNGNPPTREDWQRLREDFEQIRANSPALPEKFVEVVEAAIPPEQLEAARQRREAAWRERREQMRQEWEQRRQEWQERRAQGQDAPQGEDPNPMPRAEQGERQDRRERGQRGERGERGDRRAPRQGDEPANPGAQRPGPQGNEQNDRPRGVVVEADPWAVWIEQFLVQNKLDDARKASARAILTEMQQRRAQYRASRQADFDRLQDRSNGLSPEKRDELKAELQAGEDRLFDELKSRVDRLR